MFVGFYQYYKHELQVNCINKLFFDDENVCVLVALKARAHRYSVLVSRSLDV